MYKIVQILGLPGLIFDLRFFRLIIRPKSCLLIKGGFQYNDGSFRRDTIY